MLEEQGVSLSDSTRVPRRPDQDAFPLSFAQQRLWFLDQFDSASPAYNISSAMRLDGPLDLRSLSRAFQEVLRRHEVLRATFATFEGQAIQLISPPSTEPLPLVDLSALPAAERKSACGELITTLARSPFELSRGPLVRAVLLRMDPQQHVLSLTLHHIVSDGWSSEILMRELTALYGAFSRGESSPLPELPIQYADFAHWQRRRLTGSALDSLLSYWRHQLQGAPSLLELPSDRPRPAVQSYRGAQQSLALSPELSARLAELSRREGVTLFMLLLAGFQVLLSRLSGQAEVVVGTPVAGRTSVETEGLVGLFVNTLVLRGDVRGEPSFEEMLRRVRETCVGAYAHQEVPFEKLVEELQPERNLSHSPLFQVLFALQHAAKESEAVQTLALTPLKAATRTSKFDLQLMVEESETGLICGVEYSTDLFDASTIQRLLGNYEQLLTGVVADPSRPVSELPLLTEAERRQLLDDWNATRTDYGEPSALHCMFEAQADRMPDAVALAYEDQQLTYRQLDERANQLAHHLRSLGVGAESRVGIMLERSIEMVTGLLAILKAGGAYVPLDPDYPQDRLAFMLEDAGVPVLLTHSEQLERLAARPQHVVCVDREWPIIEQHGKERPACEVASDNLAYVIYTSGSTGKPKGAMNTHAAIYNRLRWMQEAYQLGTDDRVLQKTPFSFDVSVWEFFWPLATGARLVMARPGGHRDSAYLLDLIKREQITTLHFVPPMLQVFLDEPGVETCESLRRVVCSGEALPRELQDRFYSRLSGAELHNLYGPTEAAVDVTAWKCEPHDKRIGVPIGRPIANTQMYLLDKNYRLVPVGVAGELYIGGVQLARGYHRRPELTAERFVPHPFCDRAGERLYRTGDLARFLPGGEIEYLGRIDHQVKIRGFRIELGEIEAVLSSHPAVREAIVLAREDAPGEKRLVAYMVLQEGQSPSNTELRNALKEQLPDYMIPSQFISLEALPLTPNGKVDRRALPAPDRQRPSMERAFVAPRTPSEGMLASVWAEVLGVEQVGIHDNFFALGGDSIRSIKVLAKAKERGLNFTLQQLFQHQTVAELAASLYTESRDQVRQRTQPFDLVAPEDRARLPEDVEDAYPLTMLQAGMLYHMDMTPDEPLYHNVDSMFMRVRFDGAAFEEAVALSVARHPMLRTSFDLSSYSEPLQLVHREAHLPVVVEDLRGLSDEEQERRIDEFIIAERRRPFDLTRAPLLRFHIHLRSDEHLQFTLTECHAIQDGWSLHTMLAEIFGHYVARLKGEEINPPEPLTLTYRDFVQLEREALESPECADYWDRKLSDGETARLPRWGETERAADAEMPRVRFRTVEIEPEVSEGLNALARRAGVPIKSVLLTAHMKVLSLATGQADVLTGLVSNGRMEEAGGEQVVGLFLNTLPFRQKLEPGTWHELARSTFENEWELLPYRRYPMAALQNRLGRQLYETAFNFIHFHVVERVLRSGEVAVLAAKASEATSWTLQAHFSLGIDTLGVELKLEYDSAELSEEQIESIAGHYASVLRSMALNPLAYHEEQQFLSPSEEERLLAHMQAPPPPQQAPRNTQETPYVAPRTELEQMIASIWREVLSVERVGLHDNFFDLGGHSILMMEANRKLQAALNRVMPVMDMFQYPSVSALADYLSVQGTEAVPEVEAAAPVPEPNSERVQARREVARRQREVRKRQRADRQEP
jgi:amino acid adenylation domain-containing protein